MDHMSNLLNESTPADPRMRKTRAALYAALLALLEESPFDQITIREISARADIGYATFFRHYETKEAVLHDLGANQISHLIGLALPPLQATDSSAAALALCTYVDQHRRLWTALLTGGAAGNIKAEFIRQARHLKTEPLRPSTWLPAELAIVYCVSAVVEILAWWLQQGRGMSVRRIARVIDRLILVPFVAPIAGASGKRPASKLKTARSRKG
jgi:AcrR family transcriptional regulator